MIGFNKVFFLLLKYFNIQNRLFLPLNNVLQRNRRINQKKQQQTEESEVPELQQRRHSDLIEKEKGPWEKESQEEIIKNILSPCMSS